MIKPFPFIDAHCHLDMCKGEIGEIIKRAEAKEVKIIITQGVNPLANRKALELAKRYPAVKVALGLYPIDALSLSDREIDAEFKFIKENQKKIIAIGEVGIDFKEDDKEHERQKKIFAKIIELSKEIDKPLIVHSRNAEKECIELLIERGVKKVIMHCFCGKFSLVNEISKQGWFMSIPTNVKSSEHFQNIIMNIPLENLFCETDSPYLHPDKLHNNEPVNVIVSCKSLAF
mgnify:CR=1 FL=1